MKKPNKKKRLKFRKHPLRARYAAKRKREADYKPPTDAEMIQMAKNAAFGHMAVSFVNWVLLCHPELLEPKAEGPEAAGDGETI